MEWFAVDEQYCAVFITRTSSQVGDSSAHLNTQPRLCAFLTSTKRRVLCFFAAARPRRPTWSKHCVALPPLITAVWSCRL